MTSLSAYQRFKTTHQKPILHYENKKKKKKKMVETDLDGTVVFVVSKTERTERPIHAIQTIHIALAPVRIRVVLAWDEEARLQERPQPWRPHVVILHHNNKQRRKNHNHIHRGMQPMNQKEEENRASSLTMTLFFGLTSKVSSWSIASLLHQPKTSSKLKWAPHKFKAPYPLPSTQFRFDTSELVKERKKKRSKN